MFLILTRKLPCLLEIEVYSSPLPTPYDDLEYLPTLQTWLMWLIFSYYEELTNNLFHFDKISVNRDQFSNMPQIRDNFFFKL